MISLPEIKQQMENLRSELNSAALYNILAEIEQNSKLAEVYRRLAKVENRHAETWAQKLRDSGVSVPAFRLSWRTRILIWLARRFGAGFVLPSIEAAEQANTDNYAQLSDKSTAAMAADERSHSRLLRRIAGTVGGLEGGAVAKLERRHSAAGGNALRAAVLGASDGLLSNLSLVMGVAGAELSGGAILVSGLAGLLAGAFSMALGEWLSVQSSRELYEHQIKTEKEELETSPEEETEELALIYQAKGIEETRAKSLAKEIMSSETEALDTLVREELGIDPHSLGGSAWEAAVTSFILFAAGAVIPVIPFIFFAGMKAVAISVILSAAGLFLIGAGITLFTGKSVAYSGLRQVVFGLAASAITYTIGHLVGMNIVR
ncbi:MAG: VIT1/CCC1 family protein [Firmicutes bacterium]|nr:VIT1/CCC1 family protein [Bacillota bacterium]